MDNFQVIEGAGPVQFGNWINSLLKTSNLATKKKRFGLPILETGRYKGIVTRNIQNKLSFELLRHKS
jgi:hypothetical protein